MALVVGPIDPATNRGFGRRGKFVRGLTRQFARCDIQFIGQILKPILAEGNGGAIEGIGLHHVRPSPQVCPVNIQHYIRPMPEQHFVAPFERRSAEVFGG